ncbi:MAG: hypothetical protein GY948_01660 [Alphaproteobacteria bacterium]|nr:hypothetical protein [Alphaproteobacteria bacterium]
MKRLIEIVSWMALFFVLVFAFVEYTKQNHGPLPAIARFNPEIRTLENGRFLGARRRPIEITWRFLRKTQDGVAAEALAAIEPKKAEAILERLNAIAKARGSESYAAILAANEQVWLLLQRAENKLANDIAELNSAIVGSALSLMRGESQDTRSRLQQLLADGLLSPAYLRHNPAFERHAQE